MKLLEMVNNIIPHLGEDRVESIDVNNPTVDIIIHNIQDQLQNVLAEGWWFNTSMVRLQADSEGELRTPVNTLAYYPKDKGRIEPRGALMYDLTNRTFIHPANQQYEGRLVENLKIEELPVYAARLVMYRTAAEVYTKDFGLDNTSNALTAQAEAQTVLLRQEHLRKIDSSMNGAAYKQYINALLA